MTILSIDSSTKGRLDKYLTDRFNTPRVKIQKLIKNGDILVNGTITKPSHIVSRGDEVTIPRIERGEKIPELIPNKNISLKYIEVNNNYIIVDKPAGLVVHPGEKNSKNTLANKIISDFPEIKSVGENKMRPGIVHRLDKDTSGLLVVARTQKYFEYLKNLFQKREIKKIYIAVVEGNIRKKEDLIDAPIGRSPRSPIKRIVIETGKEAKTYYKVISRDDFSSTALLELETGRMHQIRVHLHHIHHPVLGDKLYGKSHVSGHMLLHAYMLGFGDKTYFSNPPAYITPYLPKKFDTEARRLYHH